MKGKGIKILIAILVVLIIVAIALIVMKVTNTNMNKNNEISSNGIISLGTDIGKESEPENKIETYNGADRPIAVMIDNHKAAWPQANLNEAYIVYEIIVEGGQPRLMPIYKGRDLEK